MGLRGFLSADDDRLSPHHILLTYQISILFSVPLPTIFNKPGGRIHAFYQVLKVE